MESTYALTQSATESSPQHFSLCSHLFYPLSLRLFPLSWCWDAPGSFATLLTKLITSSRGAQVVVIFWTSLGTKSQNFAPGQIQIPSECLALPVKGP